jgi:hypothetical protein
MPSRKNCTGTAQIIESLLGISADNPGERGISHGDLVDIGDMMKRPSSERMVCSIALGYAVIINIIGTSYYEFYPTQLMIGAAFGVGIAMVIGSVYFFLAEPRIKAMPYAVADEVPFHTVVKRPMAAPA